MADVKPIEGPVELKVGSFKKCHCDACGAKWEMALTASGIFIQGERKPAVLTFCPFCGKWAGEQKE